MDDEFGYFLVQGPSVMGHFASFEAHTWGPGNIAGREGSSITGLGSSRFTPH